MINTTNRLTIYIEISGPKQCIEWVQYKLPHVMAVTLKNTLKKKNEENRNVQSKKRKEHEQQKLTRRMLLLEQLFEFVGGSQ